jgi:glycerophosphoryl diester phosphodiesterase
MLTCCHRGIMSKVQENTDSGIQLSIEQKIDIIDLDVMVTNNGDIICNHDENVKDYVVGHQDTMIKTLTKDQIRNLVIDKEVYYPSGNIKYENTNKFAFLDEVFDKYIDKIIFWIDIKDSNYRPWQAGPCRTAVFLNNFLKTKLNKLHRVIVSSTNPFVVTALRSLAISDNYYHQLTIGFDYGMSDSCWIGLTFWTSIAERLYNTNYITTGSDKFNQSDVDSCNRRGIKVIYYGNNNLNNIYAMLKNY